MRSETEEGNDTIASLKSNMSSPTQQCIKLLDNISKVMTTTFQ